LTKRWTSNKDIFSEEMSNPKVNQLDAASQTLIEDQVDALRINPFLSQKPAKEQQVNRY
jgi:hypothetical protein